MPNERWQADITQWQLADGTGVEIFNIEDDHSRLDLASHARYTTSRNDVLASVRRALRRHGLPARILTDYAAVFTGQPRRGGRVALEIELDMLGVRLDQHCAGTSPLSRAYPDPEEMARRAATGEHAPTVTAATGSVPPLLQHRPPAPVDRPPHLRRAPAEAYAARPNAPRGRQGSYGAVGSQN